jgi:hypothetical protein
MTSGLLNTAARQTLWLAALCAAAAPAQAAWFGDVTLATERVERGQKVTEGDPSLAATLGWRHETTGLYASLGAATVSDERYVGSDGYQLVPTLGWSLDAKPWRAGLWVSHTRYPGADGPWFGSLANTQFQSRGFQPQTTNYATTEAGASLGWQVFTLSWVRALSDYQGLALEGPGGRVSLRSRGTTYLGLDITVPFAERWMVHAGGGRLSVPDLEELDFTDWRIGLALDGAGARFSVRASGSDAAARWRNREGRSSDNTTVTAQVSWSF